MTTADGLRRVGVVGRLTDEGWVVVITVFQALKRDD